MIIFISYKSENATIVRSVAERLMEAGFGVWFAEYSIVIENYDNFEEEVRAGISSATHAIAFTNDKWAGSKHCNMEMDNILQKMPLTNIVEVCIPQEEGPRKKYPQLKKNQPVVFRGDILQPKNKEISELLQQLGARLNIDVSKVTLKGDLNLNNTVYLPRFAVSLNTGPLQVRPDVTEKVTLGIPELNNAACFRGYVEGKEVTLWLFVYPVASPIYKMPLPELVNQQGDFDDREIYHAYRKYAQRWVEDENKSYTDKRPYDDTDYSPTIRIKVKGLHLVFFEGRSHMALTLKTQSEWIKLWERRYVISVRDKIYKTDRSRIGEVRLQFSADVRGSEAEQLQQFCSLSQHLDAIAETVKYKFPTGTTAFFNNLPILTMKACYLLLSVVLLGWLVTFRNSPWVLEAGSVLIGMLVADIGFFAASPTYRRLLWLLQPLIEDTYASGSIPRTLSDVSYWLFNTPPFLQANILYAFRRSASLVLLLFLAPMFVAIWIPMQGPPERAYLDTLLSTHGLVGITSGAALSIIGIINHLSNMQKE